LTRTARKLGILLTLAGTSALTLWALFFAKAATAFSGHDWLALRMAEIIPSFAVLSFVSLGAALVAKRRLGTSTRRLRMSWALRSLHSGRIGFGIVGTSAIGATAYALTQRGQSAGYTTMFAALAGMWTALMGLTVLVVQRLRARSQPVEADGAGVLTMRYVVLTLVAAAVGVTGAFIGFRVRLGLLHDMLFIALVAMSALLGAIPFVQKPLNAREMQALEPVVEVSPSPQAQRWAALLANARINVVLGAGVTLFGVVVVWWRGPVQFHPSLAVMLWLSGGAVLYLVYGFAWQQANAIGDASVNGFYYVLGGVPLGFVMSPVILHSPFGLAQVIPQGIATVLIAGAVFIQSKATAKSRR